MRCIACNCNLNDRESTRKSATTGTYLDLCDNCMVDVDVPYIENGNVPDGDMEEEIINHVEGFDA